ncbi:lysM and putative peptidoglycan-binding domain-containing protein 1-like isoform X2 [Oratosquilla oratoria]|uniref:lysM and putative peptidoglycan-binding domain-containing protein 1-like isoform X2 n=1 Tax=Oratosquilla oratoria TaxID=337810 RepID=UPI003F762A96
MAASSEEKGLLGSSFKSHRRYGSTSVNMKRPEHILRHRVSKLDTLQGIALKYGVTMECIKQHNKLWTTEAMFLRDYLEVPVSKDIYEHFEHTQQTNGIHQSEKEEAATLQVSCESQSCSREDEKSQTKKSPSSPCAIFDCSEKNPLDFLSQIDNNIALMKTNIEKMETHT